MLIIVVEIMVSFTYFLSTSTTTEAGALLLLGRDRKILILSPAISKFKSPASVPLTQAPKNEVIRWRPC